MTQENEVRGGSGFLLTAVAGPRQKRIIIIVLSLSLIGFVCGLPFVRLQLPEVTAFIPAYGGALWTIDVVIAVLLARYMVSPGARTDTRGSRPNQGQALRSRCICQDAWKGQSRRRRLAILQETT